MKKKIKDTKLTAQFSAAASTNNGRVHIVFSKDGWAVKKEGAKRSTVIKATKESALKAAKNLKTVERVIVHKRDGTIQSNTKKK
jgi:hypothetical protein